MDTTTARTLAADLMRQHGLTALGWTFVLDRAKTRAGQCRYAKREIGVTETYIRLNTVEDVRNTILHEIAHALTRGHGHDSVWRAKAREIGCSGARTTTSTVTDIKHRYEGFCAAGQHTVGRYHRRPGVRMLMSGFCKTHRQTLRWTDTLTGQVLNDSRADQRVITVPAAAKTARTARPSTRPTATTPAWVTGSSNWDEMWGDA